MPPKQVDHVTVLHVAQPEEAGVPRAVVRLVFDQVTRGWAVHVAAPDRGEWAGLLGAAEVTRHVWEASRGPGFTLPSEMRRLRKIVEEVKPDLIHLHSSKAGLAGRLITRSSIPTIFQPHGWSWWAAPKGSRSAVRAWERFAMRWTDVVICVSDRERSLAVAGGIRGRLHVIPNGVDTTAIGPASEADRRDARRALGLENAPTAVCVGRLHHAKGQDILLRAWPSVLRALPDATLYLVGDGPEMPNLVAMAGSGVSFMGHRTDVPAWLAAADVVVIPSRWEGMSLAMLEAMAVARCVVTTDVPGARQALGTQAEAIVPATDTDALAGALVRRLADPDLARSEGMAARAKAEGAFDLPKITAEVAVLYLELVGRTN